MDHLVSSGLALNTRRSYLRAVEKFIQFCAQFALDPTMLDERLILRFIAYLNSLSIAPSSIKVYLSAIRAWAISIGLPPPFIYTPKVNWAMRSIVRDAPPPNRVPPFTYTMLRRVHQSLAYTHDNITVFTAMLLAYFACMRSSEFCPSSGVAHHLTPSSLSFIPAQPPYMVVAVRSSKNSIKGYSVVVGCSGTAVCAYCWMRHYLARFPRPPAAPLFILASGAPLTHASLSRHMRSFARQAGLPELQFTPHSLRAGAATDAAQAGAPDSAIQQLGRWASLAYRIYMRPSQAQQAQVSRRLASGPNTY